MNFMRLTLLSTLLLVSLSCATTGPAHREADVQELLRLHQEGLRAHLASDVDLLFEGDGDEFVVVSRGEVSTPTLAERKGFLGPYLQRTRFSIYRDRIPPIVKVSADGTLGWVIAQVEAKGQQTVRDGSVQPLEFVSAWIELYEKQNGRWVGVGNVSNFKGEG